jgi:hypothetical protein
VCVATVQLEEKEENLLPGVLVIQTQDLPLPGQCTMEIATLLPTSYWRFCPSIFLSSPRPAMEKKPGMKQAVQCNSNFFEGFQAIKNINTYMNQ